MSFNIKNPKTIAIIIGLISYVAFITFILIGGGFITDVLFNAEYNTDSVGLDTRDKKNIAKMSIVMFWIVFIPLCLAPIGLGIKKEFL